MDINEILKKVDHTLLSTTATYKDIQALVNDAIKYETASVCIPPCYVKDVKKEYGDKVNICTVIGFPNGYNATQTKVFETRQAIKDGADEIDMVINLGDVKAKKFTKVNNEIKKIKATCGDKVLKVIIETCQLTEREKIKLCDIVTEVGADFIKTSTGFSTAGATFEDIKLFRQYIGKNVKMKAAGGIRSIEDAEKYIALGCERLGTSAIVKIAKEQEN